MRKASIVRPGKPLKPVIKPGKPGKSVKSKGMEKHIKKPTILAKPATILSPAWSRFMNEIVPQYVKQQFSPDERWKAKPFGPEDARFFFRGIEELSELFTEDRQVDLQRKAPKRMPAYFQQAKYRSSYLLYFLPLQAAKFLTLYRMHKQAIEAALESGRKTKVMRVVDLGAGPGTASLALILLLLNPEWESKAFPSGVRVDWEFHWLDTNASILKDGRELLLRLIEEQPKLRNRVRVILHEEPWWNVNSVVPGPYSLVLMGHVINENPNTPALARIGRSGEEGQPESLGSAMFWKSLFEKVSGGGLLMVEPAAKRFAQSLGSLRDFFFEVGLLPRTPTQIWGPCLHAGLCPLAQGRDWCHMSVPIQIPGKWFKQFSTALGSERQWVKFTYLWWAARDYLAPKPAADMRRVVSDPLNTGGPGSPGRKQGGNWVLICEPETVGRWKTPRAQRVHRGDLIRMIREKE